jgi:hypothetical protein
MLETIKMPEKWHKVYRSDEEKCVFVGKDGNSGLIRATDKTTGKRFEWRSTDALARESGLSKKRVEEILEYYCNKKVVRQHSKDPEKWGYWEVVGEEKNDPDVVAEDHAKRIDKATGGTGKGIAKTNPSQVGTPGGTPGNNGGNIPPKKAPGGIAPKPPVKAPTPPSKPVPKCPPGKGVGQGPPPVKKLPATQPVAKP